MPGEILDMKGINLREQTGWNDAFCGAVLYEDFTMPTHKHRIVYNDFRGERGRALPVKKTLQYYSSRYAYSR